MIEPEEIVRKTKLTAPHTVHCLADGQIMISMLGDEKGNGPGGFLLLDEKFEVAGRWEASAQGMKFNYDFWYQPRHNVMVSSEWAAPNTFAARLQARTTSKAGKYGQHMHFWDWNERKIVKSIDLGDEGPDPAGGPLPPRPGQHARLRRRGAVERRCGTGIKDGDEWKAEKVIEVEPVRKSRAGHSRCRG